MTSLVSRLDGIPESPLPFDFDGGVFLNDSSVNDSFLLTDDNFLRSVIEGIERNGDNLMYLKRLNNQYCSGKVESPAVIVSEGSTVFLVQSFNRYEVGLISIGKYNDSDEFVEHPVGEVARLPYKNLLLVGGVNVPSQASGLPTVDGPIAEFVQKPMIIDTSKSDFYVVKQHDFSPTEVVFLAVTGTSKKRFAYTVMIDIDGETTPTPVLSNEDYQQIFYASQMSPIRCVVFKQVELKDKKVRGLSWTPASKNTDKFPDISVKVIVETYIGYFNDHPEYHTGFVGEFIDKFTDRVDTTSVLLTGGTDVVCIEIKSGGPKGLYCLQMMRDDLISRGGSLTPSSIPSSADVSLSSESMKSFSAPATPDDTNLPNIFEQKNTEPSTLMIKFADAPLNARALSNVDPQKVLIMDGLIAVVANPANRGIIAKYYNRLRSTESRTLDTLSTEVSNLTSKMRAPEDFAMVITARTKLVKSQGTALVVLLNGDVSFSRMFLLEKASSTTSVQMSGKPTPQAFLARRKTGTQLGAIALGDSVFTSHNRSTRRPTIPAKWWDRRVGIMFEFAGDDASENPWIQETTDLADPNVGKVDLLLDDEPLELDTDFSNEFASRIEEDTQRNEPDEPVTELLKDVIDEDAKIADAVAAVPAPSDLDPVKIDNSEEGLLNFFANVDPSSLAVSPAVVQALVELDASASAASSAAASATMAANAAIDALSSSPNPVDVQKALDPIPSTPFVDKVKTAVDAIVATDAVDAAQSSPTKGKPIDKDVDQADTFWDDQLKEWDAEDEREAYKQARLAYLKATKGDDAEDFDEWLESRKTEVRDLYKAEGKETPEEALTTAIYEAIIKMYQDKNRPTNTTQRTYPRVEGVSSPGSLYVLPKKPTLVTLSGGKQMLKAHPTPLRKRTDPIRLVVTNLNGFYGTFDVVPTMMKGNAVVTIPLSSFSRFPGKATQPSIQFASGMEKYKTPLTASGSNWWIDTENHGVKVTFQKKQGTSITNLMVITFTK